MDTHADSDACSTLRAIEPVLFFGGVLLAVAVAIALVTVEAGSVIGPKRQVTAQHGH
jgi:hypothetical protein